MPIDVSPPMSGNLQGFQVAQPQSTDPLQTLSQMSQLRTQGLQQQQANLQLKQQQMQMDSNKAMMQAFVDGGGDPDKTQTLVNRDPSILASDKIGLQTHMLDLATKRSALTEQQRKIQDDENDHWAGLLIDAKDQDDVNTALATGLQQGYKPPEGMVDAQGNMTQFNDPQHIKAYANGLLALSKQDPQKLIQQQTATSAAQANEADTRNAIAQRTQAIAEVNGAADPTTGMPSLADYTAIKQRYPQAGLPDVLTPGALKLLTRSTVAAKEQPEYDIKTAQADAMKAWRAGDPSQIDQMVDKIAPVSDPMNATTKAYLHGLVNSGGTKEEFDAGIKDLFDHRKQIATETDPTVQAAKIQVAKAEAQNRQNITIQGMGTPDQPSTMAQMVANYRVPLNTVLARTPLQARDNLMGQIKAINPQFQAQYYQTFQKTENDAATGDLGKSSKALNTMTGHLQVLKNASDAFGGGNIPVLNKIAQSIGVQFGSDAKTTYDAIVHRLAPEVAKAYVAGGGTSGERGTNESDFASSLGQDQRNSNIGISAYLADSLIKANQDQYNRGTYGRGQQKLISDEAEAARQQLTQLVPANLKKQGGQQGGPPPLRYVRTSTGANNHKIGQTADGKWHDVQTGAVIQ